jgi:nucleoside-diphosphate-sugar epimerase
MLKEYAEIVAKLVPNPVKVTTTLPPKRYTPLEIGDYEADASEFMECADWDLSSASIEDLVEEAIKWYIENGKL